MIIHASYFVVSKSDFVSWNLIWVQIKFWSNSLQPAATSRGEGYRCLGACLVTHRGVQSNLVRLIVK
jgi:hypothetical protein